MPLLVGLGNPGDDYARTRHNIGFMAIDEIARALGAGPWGKRFQGEWAEARLGDEKIFLLKPLTYMNLSGQSVGAAAQFYKLKPEQIIVYHDEIDLAPGKLRVKTGGGHAGHNGLRSIAQHIGPGFRRVRIGVGHPGDKDQVANYVLHPFAKADAVWIDPLLDALAREAPALLGKDEDYQNRVASRLQPPKPERPAAPPPSKDKP